MKINPLISPILALFVGIFCLQGTAFAQFSNPFGTQKTVAQQREDILKKREDTLRALYQAQPKAKELIEKSIGYATFSNFGMKILIAGGGTGSGTRKRPPCRRSAAGHRWARDVHRKWRRNVRPGRRGACRK